MTKFVQKTFIIQNAKGMHARAAAQFVHCAEQFQSHVMVDKDGIDVPATSIMGLLLLAATQNSAIHISAQGEDAENAVDALGILIMNAFGEDDI